MLVPETVFWFSELYSQNLKLSDNSPLDFLQVGSFPVPSEQGLALTIDPGRKAAEVLSSTEPRALIFSLPACLSSAAKFCCYTVRGFPGPDDSYSV